MYSIDIVKFRDVYPGVLEDLMTIHYAEMKERLEDLGNVVSPFNPRLKEYYEAGDEGYLLTFILEKDWKAIGYCNMYITQDMHNQDLIAEEDAIFVLKEERNGIGAKFTKFILNNLKNRGIKHLTVSARTDPRVTKLWKRLGFKEIATQMQYIF